MLLQVERGKSYKSPRRENAESKGLIGHLPDCEAASVAARQTRGRLSPPTAYRQAASNMDGLDELAFLQRLELERSERVASAADAQQQQQRVHLLVLLLAALPTKQIPGVCSRQQHVSHGLFATAPSSEADVLSPGRAGSAFLPRANGDRDWCCRRLRTCKFARRSIRRWSHGP